MSNEEKILKYFSEELSPEERKKFESEIENSDELQKEYFRMEKLLSDLKESADVEIEKSYFTNLVPNLRNRMERKKKLVSIPRLAFIIPLIAVLFIVSLNIDKTFDSKVSFSLNEHNEALNEALEQATDEELSDYIDINLDYSENNFSVLSDNMDINYNNLKTIGESTLKSFDEYELINSLSEEEATEIYNKLLNKKIF